MIVFVRHGQTAPNRRGELLGRSDPALTSTGRAQATDVAKLVASLEPAAVFTSPLGRSRETAAIVAAVAGTTETVDDRLVEIDYGDWDGRRFTELPPGTVDRWRADPGFTPPGGESLMTVGERIESFCRERLSDEVLVAVSHVSPIKAAVTWALGVGVELSWRMRLDVASITRIAPGPVLLSFNEHGFVQDDAR